MSYIKIPFFGEISANSNMGVVMSTLSSDITVLKKDIPNINKTYFALQVCGKSMKNTYKNGSIILVESVKTLEKEDIVVIRTTKGDTLKRLKNKTKDRITLSSDEGKEIAFNLRDVEFLGKVVKSIEIESQNNPITLIWEKGLSNKKIQKGIFLEDALLGMRKIPSKSVDVVIADPPYNIGKDFGNNKDKKTRDEYISWCNSWINEALRCLKDDGTIFVYGFSEILSDVSANLDLNKRWLVWHYTNKNVASLNFWQRSHESILCVWKGSKPTFFRDDIREPYSESFLNNSAGKIRRSKECRFSKGASITKYNAHPNGALPRDVIKIPALAGGAGKSERHFLCKTCKNKVYFSKELDKHRTHNIMKHPTQKPFSLTEKLIKSCLKNKGTILIPFVGSGSECLISKKLGHDFIGFELNKDYFKLANGLLELK